MKKRLLITSIVMMLVVAVALSTATYAWFTSNTRVSADAVVLTAATMGGEAILIAHNPDGSDKSSTITLAAHTGSALYPATPLANTAFDSAISAAAFQNLIMDGSGKYVDPGIATPNVSFYSDTFYVFNLGFQSTTLVPTVTITYDADNTTSAMAAQSARIAIVERVPAAEVAIGATILEKNSATNMGSYSLKGIWQFSTTPADDTVVGESTNHANKAAAGANVTYGAVEGTNTNAGTFTQGAVDFTSKVSAFSQIGAATSGNQIANEYTVIVWLEGWDADCTNQITAGTFRVDLAFGTAPRS